MLPCNLAATLCWAAFACSDIDEQPDEELDEEADSLEPLLAARLSSFRFNRMVLVCGFWFGICHWNFFALICVLFTEI